MHEAAATPAWVLLAYLISGVCFILALRGLSSPESSRRGNRAGMIGMAIAVVTTIATHVPGSFLDPTQGQLCSHLVGGGTTCHKITYSPAFAPDFLTISELLAAMAIGGAIGLVTARKIQMTAMP
ncbi:MAG TPA: NAD(P)(+) transhydrogenase (Re/Si-specific) subunit beta, partial [Sphingomicrobium sp.]|nr:NAD(P)(+) transhydrogenase (Re/Si-specific) subunit beta [Sphingomicrobium sp.]